MLRRRPVRLAGALVWTLTLTLATATCGQKSPTDPSGSGGGNNAGSNNNNNNNNNGGGNNVGGGNACRTYSTAADVSTTVSGVTLQTGKTTGTFDQAAKQSTIKTFFTNGALCSTAVFTYASVADFVDEVRVVPGLTLAASNTNTNSGTCGSFVTTVTYTYDGQRRLKSMTSIGGTTTYTAWDNSGRPTAGTSNGITIANVYNDAARTLTQTQTSNGGQSVNVQTFDANGIQLKVVNTDSNGTSTTTYNNTSTAQVCK
jgi:hypothetical protein